MKQNKIIIIIMVIILAVGIGVFALIRLIQGQSDVQTINPEQEQTASEPTIETTTEPTVETTIESTVETTTEPTAETTEPTVETTTEESAVSDYEVVAIDPENMFATQSVNLRQGPSTEFDKVGALAVAQEVTVTGIVESYKGETVLWYQLDTGEFVNGGYLIDELPEVVTANSEDGSISNPATPDSSGAGNSGSSSGSSSNGLNFEGSSGPGVITGGMDGSHSTEGGSGVFDGVTFH